MSKIIFLVDKKGESRPIRIYPSDIIGDTKRVLKDTEAIWKFDGEVLNNERTFKSYEIDEKDVILTNSLHEGGINNK